MLRILRQRNFSRLWLGGLISMIGDWILIVGLPFEIYRRTGSTLATGGMVLAYLVPSIALGSVAGVFVDRWDRRRLMVAVNLVLAVTLLPLLLIDSLGLWVAYAVLLVASSVEQLFRPAEGALLPDLLENADDDLVTANALNGMNNHLARLIGPALGGLIVATGGLLAVTIIDAVTFLISAALIWSIRTERTRASRAVPLEQEAANAWRRLVAEWRDGLRVIWHQPVLRALLVFFTITRIGEGLTATLFVPWVTDALRSDSAGYGALLSTQAIGGLAGAVVIGRMAGRASPLVLVIAGSLTFGLIDLGLFTYPALYPHIWPALIVMVIVGVPGAAMMAGYHTLEQTLGGGRHRGRVIGAMGAVAGVGSLLGAIGAGILGESVPIIPLLVVQGSGYVIGGLAVYWLTRSQPSVRSAGTAGGSLYSVGAMPEPKRVTVVNDDPAFLELMQDLLQDASYAAILIDGDRDNALELVEASDPEVLIVDLRLGSDELKGLDILRRVRRHPTLRNVPTVVCTADTWSLQDFAEELRSMPGVSILTKPFHIADLYRMLEELG